MESSNDFNSTPELEANGEHTPTAREGTMKERPSSLSALVSRRALLQGGAGTAGAAIILGATPNSASAVVKLSQKVVAYQDHPDGDKDLPVDENIGDLEAVASFNQQVVGVAVSASGRVFVSFPRNGIDDITRSVAEVINGKTTV